MLLLLHMPAGDGSHVAFRTPLLWPIYGQGTQKLAKRLHWTQDWCVRVLRYRHLVGVVCQDKVFSVPHRSVAAARPSPLAPRPSPDNYCKKIRKFIKLE